MKHTWPEKILNGIHIGEHSFDADNIINEIKERCIDNGCNFVMIRPMQYCIKSNCDLNLFVEWARYLAENKIYFMFLYTVFSDGSSKDKTSKSVFTPEIVSKIYDVAGEYFLGDSLGEPGTAFSLKGEGYFSENDPSFPQQDVSDLREAQEKYTEYIKFEMDESRKVGIDCIACVEATMFSKYNIKSGIDIPILEIPMCSPEIQIAGARGVASSYDSPMWGVYLAHEWYGGRHHEDVLKRKRYLDLYKYAYISGSGMFCLESGDDVIASHGVEYERDHKLCEEYRQGLKWFSNFVREDRRPSGQPRRKVAFIHGNYDAWSGVDGNGALWGQFGRKEWGANEAEQSWKLLRNINRSIPWSDVTNFGEYDLGAFVPYGQYDVIPADSSVDKLKNYELLVFVGWNSMTEEIYSNITEYVRNGGKVVMTAAHLNTSIKRDDSVKLINNGDVSELFGCKLGEIYESKDGFKFNAQSIIPGMIYPGTKDFRQIEGSTDPFWHAGYGRYCKVDLGKGQMVGTIENTFLPAKENNTVFIENKLGDGYALLFSTLEYPGAYTAFDLYRIIVTTLINHIHSECDIKVIASDKLKFSVYEDNTVYLLNTDYDCRICPAVIKDGVRTDVELEPGEVKKLKL